MSIPEKDTQQPRTPEGIYDIEVQDANGNPYSLSKHREDYMLIVNVACMCGFAKQYPGLEELYNTYKNHKFVVLGFPCGQFANQAAETASEETSTSVKNYGITFPILQKVKVNGPEEHPLYKYLKKEKPGLMGIKLIKWNFEKFLVAPGGEVIDRFSSMTSPAVIKKKLDKIFNVDPSKINDPSLLNSESESIDLPEPPKVV